MTFHYIRKCNLTLTYYYMVYLFNIELIWKE